MLEEARRNCRERGMTNVRLHESDDQLSSLEGTFDYIHSFIVFQHIEVERGLRIFAKLLGYLACGGIGAVHVTYAQVGWGARVSAWCADLVKRTRGPFQWAGRDPRDPAMAMHNYDLDTLLRRLETAGIRDVHRENTRHGRFLGAVLYFRRDRSNLPSRTSLTDGS